MKKNKDFQAFDVSLKNQERIILWLSVMVGFLFLGYTVLVLETKHLKENRRFEAAGEVSHHESQAITNANKNRERELPVLSHSIY